MSWRAVDDELLNLEQLVRTMEKEEKGQLVRTVEEERQLVRTTEEELEGQLAPAALPHVGFETELKNPEAGIERGRDLRSFQGGRGDERKPSVPGRKDDEHRSSYHSRRGEKPRLPDPLPVSRLLDELKHFDKDKGLRKVKIEISLEDRGSGGIWRRLSEASLETNEAARYVPVEISGT